MKAIRLKMSLVLQLLAAVTLVTAYNLLKLGGLQTMPLALGVVEEDVNQKLERSIGELTRRFGQLDEIGKAVEKNRGEYEAVTKIVAEVQKSLHDVRKAQIEHRQSAPARKGYVSDPCARFLGAVYLHAALTQGKIADDSAIREKSVNAVSEIIGKTALTSSDIPLPVQYSGDVAELVGQFGAARLYGTVFPLGGSSVKLPKLKTDPTFGLIAGSGSVTEKSPQTEWVTFAAEKFGGMVRMPSELDEDSIVAMGQFLARYAARQMAYVEDYNFFRSTGAGSGLNGTAEGLTKNVVTDSKTVALASGDLAIGDVTLAKVRELRQKVDAAALRVGAYYFHPSMEHKLSGFNTSGDKPYMANGASNGATLDGFPIRWVDVMPVYSATDAASTVFGLFGDVSFMYLGLRGVMRFDTSREAGFTTDEILVRALQRLTVGKMATGAVAGIITAAS